MGTMRRQAQVLPVALLVATFLLAREPWQEKPGAQWTREEATAVLTDSPWAQRVTVMQVTGRTLGRLADGSKVVYRERPTAAPRYLSEQPERLEPEVVPGVYRVRWSSSRTVQQALARLGSLARVFREMHASPAEIPPESFVLTVQVVEPPTESRMEAITRPVFTDEEGRRHRDEPASAQDIFAGLSEEELQVRAELKTAGKRRLAPERALRHGVGTGEGVSFFFPRTENGQATLPTKTKWAEFIFESKLGDKLKARFKLVDMRVGGEPDY